MTESIKSGEFKDIIIDDGYLVYTYEYYKSGGYPVNPYIDVYTYACIIPDKEISKHVYHTLVTAKSKDINYENILKISDKTHIKGEWIC